MILNPSAIGKGDLKMEVQTKVTELKSQAVFTKDDYILEQLKAIREGQRDLRQEINERMNRLETRMDRLEEKMERLSNRQDNTLNHGNIMTASVVGVALSVIYFILTH